MADDDEKTSAPEVSDHEISPTKPVVWNNPSQAVFATCRGASGTRIASRTPNNNNTPSATRNAAKSSGPQNRIATFITTQL